MPVGYLFPDHNVFEVAAKHGQIRVLEWAQGLDLDWYSEVEFQFAAGTGDISIFESTHSAGRDLAWCEYSVQRIAVHNGQTDVLRWLKDHDLLDPDTLMIWDWAAQYGSIETLDWALQNGYPLDSDAVALEVAHVQQNVVEWAFEHGAERKSECCRTAAYWGDLGMLQFL